MQNTLKPINSPDGLFHDGNPTTGELGTIVSADWLNSLQQATVATQDELIALIKDSGQALDANRKDQLLQAVKQLAWGGNSKPTTLAGYGITDGATKAEVSIKADKAGTLAGYGIADGATTSQLRAAAPAGEVAYFAMPSAPPGWLRCDGSLASRNVYPALFEAIGTRYGAGDGTTTFNLPDLRGEFIRGWSSDHPVVDVGRAFASRQMGSLIPYQGYIDPTRSGAWQSSYNDRLGWVSGLFDDGFESNHVDGTSVVNYGVTPIPNWQAQLLGGTLTQAVTGSTTNLLKGTRPRNIALLACIKH
ncbi:MULTISPECIES: phage tail protein [Chromobacterium]|uniref:phage tail protein n=1 Tax=Chromobacterium TaxID=535 RepID=UPI001D09072A|nr:MULTISPECIES: phage tail protein [Chromobacterium]MCP1293282.1 phage tail protein [Chromobacterium sp. S0633]